MVLFAASGMRQTSGQSHLAHAVGGAPFKPLRMLHKNASSQPARLSFMESNPFVVSCHITSRARLRRTAMLPSTLSFQLRAASYRKNTSSCQCNAFSMDQCARTVASSTSGSDVQYGAKYQVSELVFPSSSHVASIRLKALRPGNSWRSANPSAETTTAFEGDFPGAEDYYASALSIPLHAGLIDEEQGSVVAALKGVS
jgi:hypothetical protein